MRNSAPFIWADRMTWLAGKPQEGYLLYDSKDLMTHGVCVGMTGSGKTGLVHGLLEEAAMDGIPAIVIDPKGDMANLLLTFPDLQPEDFRPWINEEDAGKKGLSPDEYAAQQAEFWRKGLAAWGQDGERIRQMRAECRLCDLYAGQHGRHAGFDPAVLCRAAARRFSMTVNCCRNRSAGRPPACSVWSGLDADPIRSREHILLSTILLQAWQNGQNLDLAALIRLIQDPPFSQIGVMDLESFYPGQGTVRPGPAVQQPAGLARFCRLAAG